MTISTAHSVEADTQQSTAAQDSPATPRYPLQEHERVSHPVAPPPATYREWEDGYRNLSSDPHTKLAMEKFLESLTPDVQKRINRQLRANYHHADKHEIDETTTWPSETADQV